MRNWGDNMPINVSYKGMLRSLKSKYKTGTERCYKMSDGKEFCMASKAWTVFYATLRKHGRKEGDKLDLKSTNVLVLTPKRGKTQNRKYKKYKLLKKVSGLSDTQLIYYHALCHCKYSALGDEYCQRHFKVANEMIERGMFHARESLCDGVIELSQYQTVYTPNRALESQLLEDFKIVTAMLNKLRTTRAKFATGQLAMLSYEDQIVYLENMKILIESELRKRNLTPVK